MAHFGISSNNFEFNQVLTSFKKKNPELYKEMNDVSHDSDTHHYYSMAHAEGSIWSHTMLVCNNLITHDSDISLELYLAAILHDIGKTKTIGYKIMETENSQDIYTKRTFYNHNSVSTIMAYDVLKKTYGSSTTNLNLRRILELINLHMFFHIGFGTVSNGHYYLDAKEEKKLKKIFSNNVGLYYDLLKLIRADAMGRICDSAEYRTVRNKDKKLRTLGEYLMPIPKKKESTPEIVILIGLPGSGKSTYRHSLSGFTVISQDDLVEAKAKSLGITYGEMFKKERSDLMTDISNQVSLNLDSALANSENILVDKTNLSLKSRRSTLTRVPREYYKKAVVFIRTIEAMDKVNEERKSIGRDVPDEARKRMIQSFNVPTNNEFDEIIYKFI